MDYKNEVEKLNEGSIVWKPEPGSHMVKIMAEPEETEYIDDTGKATPQIKIPINVKDQGKDWYITKGATHQSLYGQLMVIGEHFGQLTQKEIQLIVIQSKDKQGAETRRYTLPLAAEIIQEKNDRIETV